MVNKITRIALSITLLMLLVNNSHANEESEKNITPIAKIAKRIDTKVFRQFKGRVDLGLGAQYSGLGARFRLYTPHLEYVSVYGSLSLLTIATGFETNFGVFDKLAFGVTNGFHWDREFRGAHINYYFDGVTGRGWSAGIEYAAFMGYESDSTSEPYVEKSDIIWINVGRTF